VKVGHITTSSASATVPISCTGQSSCSVTLVLTTGAGTHRIRLAVKTVRITANMSTKTKLSLGGAGKRLLGKHKTIHATLSETMAGHVIGKQTLSFRAPKAK
jgi:hypothetical protein